MPAAAGRTGRRGSYARPPTLPAGCQPSPEPRLDQIDDGVRRGRAGREADHGGPWNQSGPGRPPPGRGRPATVARQVQPVRGCCCCGAANDDDHVAAPRQLQGRFLPPWWPADGVDHRTSDWGNRWRISCARRWTRSKAGWFGPRRPTGARRRRRTSSSFSTTSNSSRSSVRPRTSTWSRWPMMTGWKPSRASRHHRAMCRATSGQVASSTLEAPGAQRPPAGCRRPRAR